MMSKVEGGGGVMSSHHRSKKESGGGGGLISNDEFPSGLRILVVDNDPLCRVHLEKMLQDCLYEVTACSSAMAAFCMLQMKNYKFDIVLYEVHMPDMDGFKLLEHISMETDQLLPVIMMSSDDSKDGVRKGVTQLGACDYLIKPIGMQAIQNIWQHVVRKRRNESKELDHLGGIEDSERHQKSSDDAGYSISSRNEQSLKSSKRRKEAGEDDIEDKEDTSMLKKPRVVWSMELHQQFVASVNQLGIDKAVPKKILALMNIPWLTRENVASHLQKYRLHHSKHQNGLNACFMDQAEPNFDRLDLQSLSVSAQLPWQSNNYSDHSNIFSPEVSSLRFGEGQQQLSNTNKRVNLLHGLPTSMGLQASEGALGLLNFSTRTDLTGHADNFVHGNHSSLMLHMAQAELRGNFNGIASGQQIYSNELAGQVLVRNETVVNVRGATYNPLPQPSPAIHLPMNHITEIPENYLAFDTTSGGPSFTSTSMFQDDEISELGTFPDELYQNKSVDSKLQYLGLTFDSVYGHQGFVTNQKNEQNSDKIKQENENGNPYRFVLFHNNLLAENSTGINAEMRASSSCDLDQCQNYS